MIAFDTNVLVRYLTRDDPDQASVVEGIVAGAVGDGTSIFLGTIVLCETVWVLEGAYGHGRETIADTIEKLLLTQQFELESREDVWRALGRFHQGTADFADYLIGERARASACSTTFTFDRTLDGEREFRVLG